MNEKHVIQSPQKLRRNVTKNMYRESSLEKSNKHLPSKLEGGRVLVKDTILMVSVLRFSTEVGEAVCQAGQREGWKGQTGAEKRENSKKLLNVWLWSQN